MFETTPSFYDEIFDDLLFDFVSTSKTFGTTCSELNGPAVRECTLYERISLNFIRIKYDELEASKVGNILNLLDLNERKTLWQRITLIDATGASTVQSWADNDRNNQDLRQVLFVLKAENAKIGDIDLKAGRIIVTEPDKCCEIKGSALFYLVYLELI